MSGVTIILTAKDRTPLLARTLRYYAEVGCPHRLCIGDSSQGPERERHEQLFAQYAGRLPLTVTWEPGDMIQALLALIERVDTPYVLLAGDDDFFVPRAVDRCRQFLEMHPDYSAACGDILSIFTAFGVDGGLQLGYDFADVVRSFTDASPARRVVRFYSPQTVNTTYFVQRTDPMRQMLRRTVGLDLYRPQNFFSEGALTAGTVMTGKVRHLPGLYHVRLRHRATLISKTSLAAHDYGLFIYDEITKPGWAEKLRLCIEVIAEELRHCEPSLDAQTARHVAETVFLGWFAPRLTRNRDRLLAQWFPLATRRPWRNAVKHLPGATQLWEVVRLRTPGGLSVMSALKASSPYHRDFMPIHRALMSPAWQEDPATIPAEVPA